MRFRLATFDLDGTLADTRHDIARSLTRVIEARGEAAPALSEVIAAIGWGAPKLVGTVLGPERQAMADEVLAAFREDYRANLVVETVVYEGIPALLRQLKQRGTRLAVATNKPGELTHQLLADLSLASYFDEVVAPEDVRRPKPAPDMLRRLLERTGIKPSETVMVGDMETDLDSARAAGVTSLLLTVSGFHRPPGLAERADLVAATVEEAASLLLA